MVHWPALKLRALLSTEGPTECLALHRHRRALFTGGTEAS